MATRSAEVETIREKHSHNLLRRDTIKRAGSSVYKWMVDTGSSLSFNTPVSMTNEILVGNLTFDQSLHVRAANAAVSIFTSRPYGMFRDYVFKKMKTDKNSSMIKKSMANATASLLFGTPIYAATLALNGADKKQMLSSLAFSVLTSPVMSTVSGMYYDKARKFFGLRPAYDIRRDKRAVSEQRRLKE